MPSSRRPSRTRRLLLAALGVGFGALCTHCGPDAPTVEEYPQSRADRLRAKLEADTGTKWMVYGDPKVDDVRVIAPVGGVQVEGDTPEAKVRGLLTRYGRDMGAADSAGQQLAGETSPDPSGLTAVRIPIKHPRAKHVVFDRHAVGVLGRGGELVYVMPPFLESLPDVPDVPTVEASVAEARAKAHLQARCHELLGDLDRSTSSLGVDPALTPARLVYRIGYTVVGADCTAPEVTIDAETGAVLRVEDRGSTLRAKGSSGSRAYLIGDSSSRDIELDITEL